jgi:hypothetical protein
MPAAGRNQVDYTDIGYDALTLKVDGVTIVYDQTQPRGAPATMLDKAVTWSADDTVALAQDGDPICGKLLEVFKDGFASVQHKGFVTLPAGASATVTRGRTIVGALGAASARGYIRQTAVATTPTAAEVTEQARGKGRIYATTDLTNVVVDFGA